ncbi:hypothetical protein ACFL2Q_10535 [Thermodesulfobacteriota bacterium]
MRGDTGRGEAKPDVRASPVGEQLGDGVLSESLHISLFACALEYTGVEGETICPLIAIIITALSSRSCTPPRQDVVSILNSIVPVFTVISLGPLLKRIELTDDPFLRTSEKLEYYQARS